MTIIKNCGIETSLGLKLRVQAGFFSGAANQLSVRSECPGFRNKNVLLDGKLINVL